MSVGYLTEKLDAARAPEGESGAATGVAAAGGVSIAAGGETVGTMVGIGVVGVGANIALVGVVTAGAGVAVDGVAPS